MVRLSALVVVCGAVIAAASVKGDVDALTGGMHTRVIWREGITGGSPWEGHGHAIKGFDSQTGATTTIYNRNCIKAVIAAGGHKVLVTDSDFKLWVVNWDGSAALHLADGMVSDGWRDPASGKEYAIYRAGGRSTAGGIYRVALDNPADKTQLYNGNEGHAVYPWFQISADGTRAASFWPHDQGGVLQLPGNNPSRIANGCWSGMASDNSYRWFHLNGNHTHLSTFAQGTRISDGVNVLPTGQHGGQIYDPRPAEGPEHGRDFFVIGGNYAHYNQNSNQVEIWLGRFNPEWTAVIGWARITHNQVQDHHPGAWIGVTSGVIQPPSIELAPSSLSFTAQAGGANPPPATVTLSSPTGTLQGVTATSNRGWLNVSVSGTTITNTVSTGSLDAAVHTAQVTVGASNAVPPQVTYAVTFTVEGGAVATSLHVTPQADTVEPGGTLQLEARVRDQYGEVLANQPSVSWSVSGAGAQITPQGLYTAGMEERETIVHATAASLQGEARITIGYKPHNTIITLVPDHRDSVYPVGGTVTIAWHATTDMGMNVKVSFNAGEDWELLTQQSMALTEQGEGSLVWVIPGQLLGRSTVSDNVLFRVEGYWMPDVGGESAPLRIVPASSVTGVRSPGRGGVQVLPAAGGRVEIRIADNRPHHVEVLTVDGRVLERFTTRTAGTRYTGSRWTGMLLIRITSPAGVTHWPLVAGQ